MTTQTDTLRSLTLEVIGNYRKTAKFATKALLATSSRGIGKVDSALNSYADSTLGATVKNVLDAGQEKILLVTSKADEAIGKASEKVKNSLVATESAIAAVANKTDSTVEKLLTGASQRVSKFPPKGGKLAAVMKNDAVKTFETLGTPGAKLLRLVSAKLANGAEQLSLKATVPGSKKPVTVRKTARKSPAAKPRARRTKAA